MTTPSDQKPVDHPSQPPEMSDGKPDLDAMIAMVQRDRELIRADLEQSRRAILAQYEEAIGREVVAAMLADQEVARRQLGHDNPRVRDCALYLLAKYWKVGPSIAARCEEMLRTDPDPQVREMAILALLGPYGESQDPRVSSLLARVVADEKEHPVVRMGAFRALIDVRGLTLAWEQSPGTLRFPDGINWPFVESFLDPGHERRQRREAPAT